MKAGHVTTIDLSLVISLTVNHEINCGSHMPFGNKIVSLVCLWP